MKALIDNSIPKSKQSKSWEEMVIAKYYESYFDSIDSAQLDKDFSKDLNILVKSLSKLDNFERKVLIDIFTRFIEFYINQKIEKEIESSINKILKFKF